MKLIFVTGVEESGKDTILEMALEGSKVSFPGLDYIKFDDLIFEKQKSVSSRFSHRALAESMEFSKNMIQMVKSRDEIEKRLESRIKNKESGTLVVNGYFMISTLRGYVPILSEKFFRSFMPEMIILIEYDTSAANRHVLRRGVDNLQTISLQQDINRNFATLYSSFTGSAIKIIKVRHGEVKKAIRELRKMLGFVAE